MSFANPNVIASQATAGGDVIFLAVGHGEGTPTQHSAQVEQVTDTDQDGVVTFAPSVPVVEKSVWATVDLATGDFTVEAPGNLTPTAAAAPAGLTAGARFFQDNRQALHLLVVRPGVKAWGIRAFDGAEGDQGKADDGWVALGLNRLVPVVLGSRSDAKFTLQSGDVVIGIDPEFLTYYSVVVP